VQHRLQEEISLFFFAEGDGLHWFLNLCASVKICVQDLVFVSNFLFRFLNCRLFLTGSVESIRLLLDTWWRACIFTNYNLITEIIVGLQKLPGL
jgi:hypothetical protein